MNVTKNCRLFVLLLLPWLAIADEPRLIRPVEMMTVLQEGDQVRVVSRNKLALRGKAIRVSAEGVTIQTKKEETYLPVRDIDWFTVTRYKGNKRTWLPFTLCATLGTTSLLAGFSTEERKPRLCQLLVPLLPA